jgi:glyoxylase I family protein
MDTIERTAQSSAQSLPSPPSRLHHHAYVVKDHEANRRFIEDLLGIPLVATWCEKSHNSETGQDLEFCHTFFGLADGSALAFFQFADPADQEELRSYRPGSLGHLAVQVDADGQDEIARRLAAAGHPHRITDHGYCRSLYVVDPDHLTVEFTVDSPAAATINELRQRDAASELRRWLAGDHHANNDLRALH